MNEEAIEGNISLKILSVSECLNTLIGNQHSGNKYIDVEAEIKNVGSDKISFNCLNFHLEDNERYTHDYAFTSCREPGFSAGDLLSGQKHKGYVAFEVPNKSGASKIVYDLGVWSDKIIVIDISSSSIGYKQTQQQQNTSDNIGTSLEGSYNLGSTMFSIQGNRIYWSKGSGSDKLVPIGNLQYQEVNGQGEVVGTLKFYEDYLTGYYTREKDQKKTEFIRNNGN